MHGAAGVILINDMADHPSEADDLPKFGRRRRPGGCGHSVRAGEGRRGRAAGSPPPARILDQLAAAIDKDLKPQSFAFPASVAGGCAGRRGARSQDRPQRGRRICRARPPNTWCWARTTITLGWAARTPWRPSMTGTVHPGADDNASGTAGVIELARWFAEQPNKNGASCF